MWKCCCRMTCSVYKWKDTTSTSHQFCGLVSWKKDVVVVSSWSWSWSPRDHGHGHGHGVVLKVGNV